MSSDGFDLGTQEPYLWHLAAPEGRIRLPRGSGTFVHRDMSWIGGARYGKTAGAIITAVHAHGMLAFETEAALYE